MVNSIRGRPGGDLVLEGASSGPVLRIPPAGGASMAGRLTSSGGVTITGGGQGRNGTGASLRVTGAGDLVYNPSALYLGGTEYTYTRSSFHGLGMLTLCGRTRLRVQRGHRPWSLRAVVVGGGYEGL